eukprot:6207270-Pleurochrysis_carterae.AAC.5
MTQRSPVGQRVQGMHVWRCYDISTLLVIQGFANSERRAADNDAQSARCSFEGVERFRLLL